MTPLESITEILRLLPKRMQEVLARRFGLAKVKQETLEAIGKSFEITRERVRQIEAHALGLLEKPEAKKLLAPLVREARAYLEQHGGVRRRDLAVAELGGTWSEKGSGANKAEFVLEASRGFLYEADSRERHALWALDQGAIKRCGEFLGALVAMFKNEHRLVASADLPVYLAKAANKAFAKATPSPEAVQSYLAVSKLIGRNPMGAYGLVIWPEVSPRGVRDYAYLVFEALARPLHFRELASEMNKRLVPKHPAHEQTVHNELIKDQRFVLVGRGIYALKEWGYERGTVRDVLAAILAASRAPLTRTEIIEKMKTQRLVKENTVFLNLQNRKYFLRLGDGRYALNNKKGVQRA